MTTRIVWCGLALVVGLGLLAPPSASAQDIGVLAGVNSSNITFAAEGLSFGLGSRAGFIAGVFYHDVVRKAVGVEIEGLVSMKGATLSFQGDQFEIRATYLDVPVLVRYDVPVSSGPMIHLLAGPSFGFKLSATSSASGTDIVGGGTTDISAQIKRFEAGVVIGGGVKVQRVRLDVRYLWGLTSMMDNSAFEDVNASMKNGVFSAMVGFSVR